MCLKVAKRAVLEIIFSQLALRSRGAGSTCSFSRRAEGRLKIERFRDLALVNCICLELKLTNQFRCRVHSLQCTVQLNYWEPVWLELIVCMVSTHCINCWKPVPPYCVLTQYS